MVRCKQSQNNKIFIKNLKNKYLTYVYRILYKLTERKTDKWHHYMLDFKEMTILFNET